MDELHQKRRDREQSREHLTATRARFLGLLEGLTDADLRRPSGNSAWTIGGVLTHLVWSLELLPREVAAARNGKGMYNFPAVLRDALNLWLTRLNARGQTLESLRRRYETACAAALDTLDGVRDDEFQLGARFWSEGCRDVAGLYAAQVDHLAEHSEDIPHAISRRVSTVARTQ